MKAAYFVIVLPNSRRNTPYDYKTRLVVEQSTSYLGTYYSDLIHLLRLYKRNSLFRYNMLPVDVI